MYYALRPFTLRTLVDRMGSSFSPEDWTDVPALMNLRSYAPCILVLTFPDALMTTHPVFRQSVRGQHRARHKQRPWRHCLCTVHLITPLSLISNPAHEMHCRRRSAGPLSALSRDAILSRLTWIVDNAVEYPVE